MCKTEQSAARQRELELGLLDMLSSRKYDEISISELCQRLNIPRKSFYRYFSGKDGVLHGLIDHTMMEYESFSWCGSYSAQRCIQHDMEGFFRFWFSKAQFLEMIRCNGLTEVFIERAMKMANSEARQLQRFLGGKSPDCLGYTLTFGIGGLLVLLLTWHREGFRQSPEQMAQIAVQLLTQPLFSDAQNR